MPTSESGRQVLRVGFSALLMAAVVVLGQIPMGEPGEKAVLRLALRSVGGRVEICRDRTAEELEALPRHMRQESVCDQHSPSYRLTVQLDGDALLDEEVEPGGLRRDRPIIVDRQLEVAPGRSRLQVGFEPIVWAVEDEAMRKAMTELPRYRLDTPIDLEPDRVSLVMLDESRNELVIFSE